MKKFISTVTAIKHCEDQDCIIPSAFLSTFPNNFGINLCAVKGFEVETQDDGQLVSVKTVFIPATPEQIEEDRDPDNHVDHTWVLKALAEQGDDIE